MALYDPLFEPVQVGPITIKNRIVRWTHSTGLGDAALIAYHVARARVGVGMSTIEATSVHPLAPGRVPLWNDACLPALIGRSSGAHREWTNHEQNLFVARQRGGLPRWVAQTNAEAVGSLTWLSPYSRNH